MRLNPNKQKILEAVLYLIQYAQERGYAFTQYSIVKSIFIADVNHIKKFGRPVTFDNFSAMENGPVGQCTYNLIRNDNQQSFDGFGINAPLWTTIHRPDIAQTAYQYKDVTRAANLKKLSKTDQLELAQAADLANKLGFFGVKDFTHEHPAYKDAWQDEDEKRSFPMDYRLLMPTASEEDFYELLEVSRHY